VPEFVGLLPAAGLGSRLPPIPASKEIMPLGFRRTEGQGETTWHTVTPIEEHLRALKLAGASRCIVVINAAKPDIMRYLGGGERFGFPIAYLVAPSHNPRPFHGMPFSLDLARPWIGDATTLFAMPDTVIVPRTVTQRLAHHHTDHAADLTLGLFHTATPWKYGMVALDEAGDPEHFVDKPVTTDLDLMWGLAAWSPRFGTFLHDFLAEVEHPANTEIVLSEVLAAAIHHLIVKAIVFGDAQYHDIGTPADFQSLVIDLAKHHSR
jgi:glucose-1-phosphate thymidylyltransferase